MDDHIVNVLLLGETGVGKSTLINALANYLTYDHLKAAASNPGGLLYLVPTRFSLVDNDLLENVVSVGSSSNEEQTYGVSATQNPKSYKINLGHITLRIIDTPGMADTRGTKYDDINAEKLLWYISEFNHLNAICILFKADTTRMNVLFEYCAKKILSKLDKTVQDNIIFLFTHGHSNSGAIVTVLEKVLAGIPDNRVRVNAQNRFRFENASFRYLAATAQGIRFTKDETENYARSWKESSETCMRLIEHILNLSPSPMQGTITINESRRTVANLVRPLAEILVVYDKAIERLREHEDSLKLNETSIIKLKEKLYIPITEYKVVQIIKTTTTTTSCRCSAGIGLSLIPPFFSFNVGYDQNATTQSNIQEIIEPVERRIEDVGVKSQIDCRERAVEMAAAKIDEINNFINEYADEAETLLKAAVKFGVFLRENAIVVYDDVFVSYFTYLLQRWEEYLTNPVYTDILQETVGGEFSLKLLLKVCTLLRKPIEIDALICFGLLGRKRAGSSKENYSSVGNTPSNIQIGTTQRHKESTLKPGQPIRVGEQRKGCYADGKMLKNLRNLLTKYEEIRRDTSNVSAVEITGVIEELLRLKHCGAQLRHFHEKVRTLKISSS